VIVGIADTRTALWYLLSNPLLSATARRFIDDAAAGGNEIGLSSISLAEIVYLTEKNRLPVSAYGKIPR
jgi:PIN domain nuclease of toxin-antitoxin system